MSPSTIAHFRLTSKLGAGGMGEVWRATDTKLNRDVAVKILPASFAHDPDRLARFTREAQVLASLNHSNIAAIYGVEERALIMELIPGPTLAERITQGPIPLDEAIPIAKQIAEALEYAHERGIVHRDLKPANINVTPEGRVKVLDFGLAKALAKDAAPAAASSSPTITMGATMEGVILGTAAYMSPEQARGQEVDKRADIWSFGVVLYEMLTGRALFASATISDTLASVLKTELDLSALPAETPPAIRNLLSRCLERDRKRRLRDIGDAFLEEIQPSAPASVTPVPSRRPYFWMAAVTLLSLALLLVAIVPFRQPTEPAYQVSLMPPEKAEFTAVSSETGGFSLSPDGSTLAFIATQEGKEMLWVRRLDSLAAHPLAGTESAYYPFWSPDSGFVAFFSGTQLKKIDVTGGPPLAICDAPRGHGGTWNREGVIVFSGMDRTLYRVPAAGGEPVRLTTLDAARKESSHYWPEFLPDGKHFLYLNRLTNVAKSAIWVGSIDDKPEATRRTELVSSTANAIYVPPPASPSWRGGAGWFLFTQGNTLLARRFDASRLQFQGEAVPVADRVDSQVSVGLAGFSASQGGLLVYNQSGFPDSRLTWTTRDGRQSPATPETGAYLSPRLSPDGAKVAVAMIDSNANADIWQIDLAHSISTRFTFDPAPDIQPSWSPDGQQIVFASSRGGPSRIYLKMSGGTADERRLEQGEATRSDYPNDWSRGGDILYTVVGGSSGADLWVLPMTGNTPGKPVPFLDTPFREMQGRFSPDGKWVAYVSDESGRNEVYVRSFPGTASKSQISNNGGAEPVWRGDGRELYYLAPDGKLMAVTVKTASGAFEIEAPHLLFQPHWLPSQTFAPSYDVTRDGQRFLGPVAVEAAAAPLTLLVNWPARLAR